MIGCVVNKYEYQWQKQMALYIKKCMTESEVGLRTRLLRWCGFCLLLILVLPPCSLWDLLWPQGLVLNL